MPSRRRCFMSNAEHELWTHGSYSPQYNAALARPSTCLLPNGHDGPHEWTFDGDVQFVLESKQGSNRKES